MVAAAATGPDDKEVVAAWDTESGKRLWQGELQAEVTALALSPDQDGKKVLAVADKKGGLRFWSLPQSNELRPIKEATRLTIHSLAFSPDSRRLAVGDAGGTVGLWDYQAQRLLRTCDGCLFDVYAVAFNPDGTLLATGGNAVKLWDAATGRLLLDVTKGVQVNGLAFSPDGALLAASSRSVFSPGGVDVWELNPGRGIITLRGLVGQSTKLRFSPDGRRLAALALNWQVGIWNVETGHLEHILNVPPGDVATHAALAFSSNGRRFAFVTGTEAKLWDLDSDSAKELGSWRLPLGLKDALAFHPSGRLLLLREETEAGDVLPRKSLDHQKHPRVCRLRELTVLHQPKKVKEIRDFNKYVHDTVASVDGTLFLVDGLHSSAGIEQSMVRAFDTGTGEVRWSIPTRNRLEEYVHYTFLPDPSGLMMGVLLDHRAGGYNLVEVATGKSQSPPEAFVSLGPGAEYFVGNAPAEDDRERPGPALFRRGERAPLVVLGQEAESEDFRPQFSRDGNRLAWSNKDGTIGLCNLRQIRERLAQLGLGW
jgi:WD40 repeat protein